ncbi:MAG: hypothetical protein EOO09_20745 [Chitinophagaceae bacterium]|nr:MAG: hypothetical protein EOO09_20745 [Chitinophagaceae bacterium]
MPKAFFTIALLFSCLLSSAQKTTVRWGEEFKMRKGSTDLTVVFADKSGVYLEEGHLALKSYYVIGASLRSSAKLIKLDQNLNEIFTVSFDKELKGKEFIQFFVLKGKIWLFASEELKKEGQFIVHAAEVTPSSGVLSSTWKTVTTLPREKKSDRIQFKIAPGADSLSMTMVTTMMGNEKEILRVEKFDAALKSTGPAAEISNEFDRNTYKLEDVIYTSQDRIIVVGRTYEYREGKKKKDKFLDFVKYNVRMYDQAGKQLTDLDTDVEGKWITSTKVVQQQNRDLIVASFYSEDKKAKKLDGMMVQRLNSLTGAVVSTTNKKLDHSLLDTGADEDDDQSDDTETKAERKERQKLEQMKDEGEEFSAYMKFRQIFYTADGGLLVVAEQYHNYTTSSYTYTPGTSGRPGSSTYRVYDIYECGEILMCKLDAASKIGWLKVLPKMQREVLEGGSGAALSYFASSNLPFYAGFGAMQVKDKVMLFFNDIKSNGAVTQAGQRIKKTTRFGRSDCFAVSIDPTTGALTRKVIFSNSDNPTAMPRLGSVINNEMYLIGKDDKALGKSKVAIAKLTVK